MNRKPDDLITDALERFGASLSAEQRRDVEVRLRLEFGGRRFYIRKPAGGYRIVADPKPRRRE